MPTIYIGTTYFTDGRSLYEPFVTCMNPEFQPVYDYLVKVRKLPVLKKPTELPEDHLGKYGYVAVITSMMFSTDEAMYAYLGSEECQPFNMTDWGEIDHHMVLMSKKEARHVWIPMIAMTIINNDVDLFRAELRVTSHSLKGLLYYMNGADPVKAEMSKDSKAIMRVCELVDGLTHPDSNSMAANMQYRHPILFCGEDEYRTRVRSMLNQIGFRAEYRQFVDLEYT